MQRMSFPKHLHDAQTHLPVRADVGAQRRDAADDELDVALDAAAHVGVFLVDRRAGRWGRREGTRDEFWGGVEEEAVEVVFVVGGRAGGDDDGGVGGRGGT